MIFFYLVFLLITLAVGYNLLQQGRKTINRLRSLTHVLTIVDLFFLLLESLVWLFMLMVTIDALMIEFSPGRPKPYFLVTWGLGIVAYGVLSFLKAPVDAFLGRLFNDPGEDT